MSESEQETRGYHNIPEPIDIGEVRRITGRSKPAFTTTRPFRSPSPTPSPVGSFATRAG